jgi:hypothetical protein
MKNKGMAPAGQSLQELHEADMRRLTPIDPPWYVQVVFYVVIGAAGSLLLAGFFGFLDRNQLLP